MHTYIYGSITRAVTKPSVELSLRQHPPLLLKFTGELISLEFLEGRDVNINLNHPSVYFMAITPLP